MKNKIWLILLIGIFIVCLIMVNRIIEGKNSEIVNISDENIKEEKMKVLDVTTDNFEEEVLKNQEKVLIDFYADWCGPCKMLSPIVEEVAEENENIKVCRINIDDEQDLAVKYGIMSIPTLVVIENGEEKDRVVGVVSKSEILSMIK